MPVYTNVCVIGSPGESVEAFRPAQAAARRPRRKPQRRGRRHDGVVGRPRPPPPSSRSSRRAAYAAPAAGFSSAPGPQVRRGARSRSAGDSRLRPWRQDPGGGPRQIVSRLAAGSRPLARKQIEAGYEVQRRGVRHQPHDPGPRPGRAAHPHVQDPGDDRPAHARVALHYRAIHPAHGGGRHGPAGPEKQDQGGAPDRRPFPTSTSTTW